MTNLEQIFHSFPLHAQRIVEAIHEDRERESDPRDASAEEWLAQESGGPFVLMMTAFIWDGTPEGCEYWVALRGRP